MWKEMMGFFGKEEICVIGVASYRTSIVSYQGNSGSPVFNDSNVVVVVLFAGEAITNYGYIIPVYILEQFLQDAKKDANNSEDDGADL